MKLLPASWDALREFTQSDDQPAVEELLDEILAVELRRREKQIADRYARQYNSRPEPWIPTRSIYC